MNLLVVGKKGPANAKEALAGFFDADVLEVVHVPDLGEAIVRQKLENGTYDCLVLDQLAVLQKQAELLSVFLSLPGGLPVAVLHCAGLNDVGILLVTEVESTDDRFLFLLRRFSRFSSFRASHCIDTGETMIVEYRPPAARSR